MDMPFDYAAKQNIMRFRELLMLEDDRTRAAKLQKLLIREEDKLGFSYATLEDIEREIKKGKKRIELQQELVATWEREGRDATLAKALLENLTQIEAMYRQYRQTIIAAIERNRL